MRDYRDQDRDLDDFPYRRPAVSSWIAAIAVAFAFFTLGGFIKTYRQLESLREESRREIEDLRQHLRRLQAARASPGAPEPRRRVYEALPEVPGGSRRPGEAGRGSASSRPDAADRPFDLSRYALTGESRSRGKLNLEIGNRSPETPAGLADCRVISTAGQKTVMVEGGRDVGRGERTRLALYRGGTWIADVRVSEVFDNMASCEVLHFTLPPEPGDRVRDTSP